MYRGYGMKMACFDDEFHEIYRLKRKTELRFIL